jgi:molybdopterin molybdotransferase
MVQTVTDLLNVDRAIAQILNQIGRLDAEEAALTDALGRVLADDVVAAINLPPFPNSSMDGYAVRAADTAAASQDGPARLRLVEDIPAGAAPTRTISQGQAARIMTGAPMPAGADAVVPVEQTDGSWERDDSARSLPEQVGIFRAVEAGANVRLVGEDIQAGEQVLAAGTPLRPQEIGVLAALGHARVRVVRRPRVAILSNGNELVGAEDELAPGKIRDVNSYTLAGLVLEHGGIPLQLPVARDTPDEIRRLFRSALAQQPDMMISSAGVSVGAADYIHDILRELGQVDFWRINLRPGKPLAFGQIEGVPFFGLPGNPVSAMVTFDVLVRPALFKLGGREDDWPLAQAVVAEDMRSDGRRSFIRVRLEYREDRLWASSTGTQSSGALMSMVLADGLLVIPEDVTEVKAGTMLPVRVFRLPGPAAR